MNKIMAKHNNIKAETSQVISFGVGNNISAGSIFSLTNWFAIKYF